MQLKNIKVTWEDIAKRTITLAVAETDNGNVQNMISSAPKELSECIVSYTTRQKILTYDSCLHITLLQMLLVSMLALILLYVLHVSRHLI